MDDFVIHVGHLLRQYPSPLRVGCLGYVRHKQGWIRDAFPTFNYSFILSGGGVFRSGGKEWEVRAPCVIMQKPGVYVEYGPVGEWSEWEEFYVMYYPEIVPALERMNLLRENMNGWYIQDPGLVRARLTEIRDLVSNRERPGFLERLDRVCDSLVLDAILSETPGVMGPEERSIREIRDHVSQSFTASHDFDELARTHGFSQSSFRRYWRRYVGIPPAKYVMKMRIQEACRLLVETDMKIGEIAQATGFDDPLYFSRRFRLETGASACEYRENHRFPLSFD